MKGIRRTKARHRRDWRRLWRYCRCGYRWRCLDGQPPPSRVRGTNQRSAEYRAGSRTPTRSERFEHPRPGER
ncbi:hypothetical protein [Plantactinospora soyae]|uniref:Uncharacterized protein n=1 Tax=Plantactinospora soyae TaxID=1544732 RepID=A0A927MBJ1_9ACTN|nr:hypothetical protein [Plantactinospora soyae]MBE1488798.1 hypothetical protein [Plantactinospora soyae]